MYDEAATVKVHPDIAQCLNIRTLGEAMHDNDEMVARFVLFPQQVDILNQSPPRAFFTGPPGTGKTLVLIMQGLIWIQRGYDVHVVSTCDESRAATFVIKHQLQKIVKTTERSHVYRHQFDFEKDAEVKKAVSCLKFQRERRQACVIADEIICDDRNSFSEFCAQLIKEVPSIYIWCASMYHDVRPSCLEEIKLTTPLTSPSTVVREVMESNEIKNGRVYGYTFSDVSFPDTFSDVPFPAESVIKIIHHKGQSGHTSSIPQECTECGHEIARILKELDVGRTGDGNNPRALHYRDVLVLCFGHPTNDRTTASSLVRGLQDRNIPMRVVEEGDETAICDTELHVKDLVTVASWGDVRGLHRRVVVVASGTDRYDRLHAMSRCTSQLVLID